MIFNVSEINQLRQYNCNVAWSLKPPAIFYFYDRRRKNKKKRTGRDTDYTQRNGRTHILYYACVSERKVQFSTSKWPDPPQRKRSSKIRPNGKCDRNGPLTVRHRSPDLRPRADTF